MKSTTKASRKAGAASSDKAPSSSGSTSAKATPRKSTSAAPKRSASKQSDKEKDKKKKPADDASVRSCSATVDGTSRSAGVSVRSVRPGGINTAAWVDAPPPCKGHPHTCPRCYSRQ